MLRMQQQVEGVVGGGIMAEAEEAAVYERVARMASGNAVSSQRQRLLHVATSSSASCLAWGPAHRLRVGPDGRRRARDPGGAGAAAAPGPAPATTSSRQCPWCSSAGGSWAAWRR
uniref:Uncharacterized protein n=1 Tax=Aegilops tauschii TaxID=37682 RepID=R7W7H5_AEGTA